MCAIGSSGVACVARGNKNSERDKNRKVDGEEEKKKKDFFGLVGAWENRPMTPTKKALRANL